MTKVEQDKSDICFCCREPQWLSRVFHEGKTCYRELGKRFNAQQLCYNDETGECRESPDKVSPVWFANSKDTCVYHPFWMILHWIFDVIPFRIKRCGRWFKWIGNLR